MTEKITIDDNVKKACKQFGELLDIITSEFGKGVIVGILLQKMFTDKKEKEYDKYEKV